MLDGNVSEVSSMLDVGVLRYAVWSSATRRPSSWTALLVFEVVVRRCYVYFLRIAFLSAFLCPGPSSLFLTVLYGLCCDYGVTVDCFTVCLLFPSCCLCATTCSRM